MSKTMYYRLKPKPGHEPFKGVYGSKEIADMTCHLLNLGGAVRYTVVGSEIEPDETEKLHLDEKLRAKNDM